MPDAPHNFDRRTSDPNIAALALRVDALERRMETFSHEQRQITTALESNTRLTEDIHGNTADIVEAMSDLKVLGRWGKRIAIVSKYIGIVAGAVAAVWAMLNLRR